MNLLYYPRILVPPNELKRILLYSDTFSTIVPDEFSFYDSSSEDEVWNQTRITMGELMKMGIYKPSGTYEVLRKYKDKLFAELESRIANIDAVAFHDEGQERTVPWQLYLSKMDHELRYMLREKKLVEEYGNTLLVEADTAAIYMGLLAEYSSLESSTFYSTITDEVHYRKLVYDPVDDSVIKTKFVLNDILPVPIESVSIEQILDFKESRKEELARFQALLEGFEKQLIDIHDLREYRLKIRDIENNIKNQSNVLERLLKEHAIVTTTKCIDKVVNVVPKLVKNIITEGEIIKITPVAEKFIEREKIRSDFEAAYLVSAKENMII